MATSNISEEETGVYVWKVQAQSGKIVLTQTDLHRLIMQVVWQGVCQGGDPLGRVKV